MKIHHTTRRLVVATFGLAALTAGPAYATDQALLDALVRKGILTDKEAKQIEEEVSKEAVVPPPVAESKIKLGDGVKEAAAGTVVGGHSRSGGGCGVQHCSQVDHDSLLIRGRGRSRSGRPGGTGPGGAP